MTQETINPQTLKIDKLMGGYRLSIPRYQRAYAWDGDEQVEDLLRDIDSALTSDARNYFIGAMLCVERDSGNDEDSPRLEVVDGQQRLTTMSLIFAYALHYVQEHQAAPDIRARLGVSPNTLGIFCRKFLYVERDLLEEDDEDSRRPLVARLKLGESDNRAFRQIVQNGPGVQGRGKGRQLADAYGVIRDFFQSAVKDHGEKYIKDFVHFLAKKVRVVVIFISDEANAYEIFEVLNARSMHLSAVDLIKNKLLSCFGGDEDELDRAYDYWRTAFVACGERPGQMQEYVRCLLQMREGQKVDPKMLYRSLRDLLGERNKREEAMKFLRDLDGHSHEFAALRCKDDRFWDEGGFDPEIKPVVGYLNDFRVVLTVMLSMLYGRRPPEFVYGAYRLLSVFMKRTRAVRDRLTVMEHYEDYFADLAKRFAGGKSGPRTLSAFFSEIKSVDADCLQVVPDEMFIQQMANRPRIKDTNAKAILVELANHVERRNKTGVQVDLGTVTLEHILPKKPKDLKEWSGFGDEDAASLWLERLGNLALLESAKNTTASNRKFADKKRLVYNADKCGILLTNELCDLSEWTPDTVKERQLRLAKLAAEVWSFKVE